MRIGRTWDLQRLRQKSLGYWLWSILSILTGFCISLWLHHFVWWQRAGHVAYNTLIALSPATTTHPKHTAVVLIDDEDYWRGDWARRVPLKRQTLAKLLRLIKDANARAIGVDVDLRCQTADGQIETHEDYRLETAELLQTANDIAREIPLVFVKTGVFDESQTRFLPDADVFDRPPFTVKHFSVGHAYLPHDLRQVALGFGLGRNRIESLTSSLSGHVDHRSLKTAIERSAGSLPYVRSFFSEENFQDAGAYVSAGRVLAQDPEALRRLANRVVIVGGGWHVDALGRGPRIDEHETPQGHMPGALVHANYVEAVLSEQLVVPSGKPVHIVAELIIGLLLASIFACAIGYWKVLYLLVLGAIVCTASVVSWANLGIFIDSAPPLILLAGHAVTDKVLGWKRSADHHRHDHAECGAMEHE